ncbi:hypothetical protein ElyMa_001948900 [Elysia marginata]|uniref:Uncharacterized protein n=1 Tax=Elysia marginata TaxID=1093978 RepID=A0AAV4EYY9_9GAST|nr:hypothetical protein ElyMa_001948900 [Elysia marginata]
MSGGVHHVPEYDRTWPPSTANTDIDRAAWTWSMVMYMTCSVYDIHHQDRTMERIKTCLDIPGKCKLLSIESESQQRPIPSERSSSLVTCDCEPSVLPSQRDAILPR